MKHSLGRGKEVWGLMGQSKQRTEAAAILGAGAARVVVRASMREDSLEAGEALSAASLEDAMNASVSVCAPVREAGEEDTDAR